MVGIRYTGTDGRTTSFSSSSVDDAMGRLSRIPGYSRTKADDVAAELAGGWRERHLNRMNRNLERGMPFVGQPGGSKYSSGNGVVSGLNGVSDIRVENGKLVKTSQQHFVSEGGKTVGVGPKRTETLGDIETKEQAKDDAAKTSVSGSVDVIVGTSYDASTHQLVETVAKLSVSDGRLKLSNRRLRVITTAVQETIAR